jgi:Trk K+ transport system NAD-binding subunit
MLDFAHDYVVMPWAACGSVVGKTLIDADLRRRFRINVLGFRPAAEAANRGVRQRLRIPEANRIIDEGDTLMIVGEEDDVAQFILESDE